MSDSNERSKQGILSVDDDPFRELLAHHVRSAGYRPVLGDGPQSARETLANDGLIRLVISDVRMPDRMTVAEGVESSQVWDTLSAWGCDQGQGYYMGPADAAGRTRTLDGGVAIWSVTR